jgi:hypothetical protein
MQNEKNLNNKLLLEKLINLLQPKLDKNIKEKAINYYNKLLMAQTNLSCYTNTQTIINNMQEKIKKIHPKNFYPQIEKLQQKHDLLLSKNTIFTKRWAILLLLLKLSKENNEYFTNEPARNLFNIFQAEEQENEGLNNIKVRLFENTITKEKNFTERKAEKLKKNEDPCRSTQKNIVVLESKSNKKITEYDIVNDLIFVFQGIDGHFINFNKIENSFTLNSLIPWKESILDIVHYLSELGWLYKKVYDNMNNHRLQNTASQFVQSFYNGIQSELNEYYK